MSPVHYAISSLIARAAQAARPRSWLGFLPDILRIIRRTATGRRGLPLISVSTDHRRHRITQMVGDHPSTDVSSEAVVEPAVTAQNQGDFHVLAPAVVDVLEDDDAYVSGLQGLRGSCQLGYVPGDRLPGLPCRDAQVRRCAATSWSPPDRCCRGRLPVQPLAGSTDIYGRRRVVVVGARATNASNAVHRVEGIGVLDEVLGQTTRQVRRRHQRLRALRLEVRRWRVVQRQQRRLVPVSTGRVLLVLRLG